MAANEEKEGKNTKDIIIRIILIIIIILLLIHNCVLIRKNGEKENTNIINITCDDQKCEQTEAIIDCMKDINNPKCIVPDFTGKTKADVVKWLNSISDIIDVEYVSGDGDGSEGTILEQSLSGITIKELLDNNNKIIMKVSNKGTLVDCMKDVNNSKCIVPDFTGKTKADIEKWLSSLLNNIKVKYTYDTSNKNSGIVLDQSDSGITIKDLIDKGGVLTINIAKKSKSPSSSKPKKDNGNKDNTNINEQTEEENTKDFYVNDSKIKWSQETTLDIFKDSLYKIDGVIAPESSNTYKFIVNNDTIYNLKYDITFEETNSYNINMKYKLKKGDTYLIDNYVSFNELNLSNISINSNSQDTYYLEWKWISSDNDTNIGLQAQNTDINYDLKILVEAVSE